MTRADELLALAEACEKATGPKYELERLIWIAIGSPAVRPIPVYTASLDAAMTLAPVQWKLRQMHFNAPCADDRKWHLNLHGGRVGEDTFVGRGTSPALAICSAALRALAAIETGAAA